MPPYDGTAVGGRPSTASLGKAGFPMSGLPRDSHEAWTKRSNFHDCSTTQPFTKRIQQVVEVQRPRRRMDRTSQSDEDQRKYVWPMTKTHLPDLWEDWTGRRRSDSRLQPRAFKEASKYENSVEEEGSYLLCSGYWALARHFNYIGDMVMCVGWTVACAGPNHGFPWIPLSYVVYFWLMDLHRLWRDEERCAKKYKKDWTNYQEKVPYFILPGIF